MAETGDFLLEDVVRFVEAERVLRCGASSDCVAAPSSSPPKQSPPPTPKSFRRTGRKGLIEFGCGGSSFPWSSCPSRLNLPSGYYKFVSILEVMFTPKQNGFKFD
ncbi:hypothetical protein DY000_02019945 [Brassica cretica]|uniref:Uncharacterized protein n=1 Tax=Brassica cretica TaxID=69181 RepID=A0ABQ7D9Q3_BRACR|nr:hypothetical protein DY000_02019945 [Brassica cretica]